MTTYTTRIYASPNGGSGAAGTLADPASLTRAQTLARAAGATSSARVLILLRGGTYTLTAPLALTAADSYCTYQAYRSEVPVLSGGEDLATGWSVDSGSVYKRTWSGHSRQLWVNGTRATRARSAAQSGWTVTASNPITAPNSTIAGFARPQDVELVQSSRWRMFRVRVASASSTSVTVNANDWADAQLALNAGVNMDAVDWYENARELVTTAGYWYHNRNASTLYYQPRNGETMGTTSVVGGNLEVLVTITGTLDTPATGIELRGIAFSHATWTDPDSNGYTSHQTCVLVRGASLLTMLRVPAAVRLYAANGCAISGCTFSHLGAAGISLEYGSQYCVVENNAFSDVSGSGVTVGDVVHCVTDPFPTDARAKLSYNVVRNNVLASIGVEYYDAPGIWLGYTDHTTVANNEISGAPYGGICSGWGWGYNDTAYGGVGGTGWPNGQVPVPTGPTCIGNNAFTGNKVTTFAQLCGDCGGVYLSGVHAATTITANYVSSASGLKAPQMNYYLDAGVSGVTVTGNVADGVRSYGFFAQQSGAPYAHGNTFDGNYANGENAGGIYADNVSTNYTVGTLGATALAIKAAAGRE